MTEELKISKPYLLDSHDLTYKDIEAIFKQAEYFIENYDSKKGFSDLAGITVAMAFFEPSTRTKLSFELAAKRLGANSLSFSSSSSSLTKGESLIDTLRTIEAMDVQMYVVRHELSGTPKMLQEHTNGIILNAGDGKHEHPTQALLDSFTLYRRFGSLDELKGKKIVIAGDILHSRVARSNITVLKTLGCDVKLCGPGTLLPRHIDIWDLDFVDNIDEAVDWADVIIMLRLQHERMGTGLLPSLGEFSKYYSISTEQFERKPDLLLMHPGPVNYGVELAYEVAEHKNCMIQTQVTHGVYIRMALLKLLAKHLEK